MGSGGLHIVLEDLKGFKALNSWRDKLQGAGMGGRTVENVSRKAMGGVGPEPMFSFSKPSLLVLIYFLFQLSV